MEKSPTNLWTETLDLLRKEVGEQAYDTWFRPTRGVGLKDKELTVEVPNQFFGDWLLEHYQESITKRLI